MRRRVFFSFHYRLDSVNVAQVRNAWTIGAGGDAQPLLDKAAWEQIRLKGDTAVRSWIDTQMKGTSVTVVLYGTQTYLRPWVQYEILKSYDEGRGLLGVSLVGMKGFSTQPDYSPCPNPFPQAFAGRPNVNAQQFPTYGWVADDGRNNMGRWVEDAARRVSR